jgi:mannose-1-phosphate guanylyltransferase/mannose-6-phosphate isomerase
VSRQEFPKQLLQLTGDRSLLQQTALRLSGDRFAPAIIVSGEEQRFFIQRQLELVEAPVGVILLEPVGRNTSAAAALAAVWVQRGGSDEILLLMPSDQVIGDREAFLKALEIGLPHAERGGIVTFGAQPTEPNTQYGYIEADTGAGDGAFPIARFHEKPDSKKAAEYVQSGRFFWNAGIFLMKATTLLEEMRRFLPKSLDAITRSMDQATTDGPFVRPAPDGFNRAENISIDHGIMEKTNRGMVVPVQMDWSDVGTWDSVWKLGVKDARNNAARGNVVALDTNASLLWSDGPLVATIGLDKIAVIAVGDAVLVAPLNRVSDLKALVDQVKAEHSEKVTSSPRSKGNHED